LEKKVQDKKTEEIVSWLRDNDDKLRTLFGDLGGERKVLELIKNVLKAVGRLNVERSFTN